MQLFASDSGPDALGVFQSRLSQLPRATLGWEYCGNSDKQRRRAIRSRPKTSVKAPAPLFALSAKASNVPTTKSAACECSSETLTRASSKSSKRRCDLAGHVHAARNLCASPSSRTWLLRRAARMPDLALHVHRSGNRRSLLARASRLLRVGSGIFRVGMVARCTAIGCYAGKREKGGVLHLPLPRAAAELKDPGSRASGCADCDSRL